MTGAIADEDLLYNTKEWVMNYGALLHKFTPTLQTDDGCMPFIQTKSSSFS